ncbi:hypothetical protein BZG02_14905 [Labilibaculum filiforme]|uniref:Uncharacterized protein n=1 Tax=Labilibaculum filiforme TaxID=1940526 RepID=A0A2N3HUL0_9BACT|nr:hypothetical protein [Labilibaculum filiforme]PKQ61711.1 hypothetical protein BZG02_14905 [Labilibaculum filiforme]
MKYSFTSTTIEKLSLEYSGNQNFIQNTLPRIKIIHTIKKEFNTIPNLEWYIEYSPTNINTNRILIQYQNQESKDFNFFYEIPLSLNFEFRVYLSNSSIHFIDLYNFLLKKEIIHKDQYSIKAAYHTIPHFTINSKTKRYDLNIINKYVALSDNQNNLIDEKVKNEIESGFKTFNPIFDQIIAQFKI